MWNVCCCNSFIVTAPISCKPKEQAWQDDHCAETSHELWDVDTPMGPEQMAGDK